MTFTRSTADLAVGDVLSGPARLMSRERMRWYCDALETTALGTGQFVIAEPTIHSDDDFAIANGLPGIIADGMISTNWISGMLVEQFGLGYVEGGELQTKFIRPIYEDEVIETRGEVRAVGDGERPVYVIDVWCETADGQKCTVGQARIPVPAG